MAGVNGLAVGLAGVGGLLLWSGLKNVTPADTLRQSLKLANNQTPISTPFGQVTSGLGSYSGPAASGDGGNAASAAAGGAAAGSLLAQVRAQIGKPYRWASTGPDSFDCSGLVIYGLKRSGFPNVPRFTTATFGSWAKANGFTRINNAADFQAGDVVVKTGHMGVSAGGGRMVHAPHTGAHVRENALWAPLTQWWAWRIGKGVLTAPTTKPQGTAAQEKAELGRIG